MAKKKLFKVGDRVRILSTDKTGIPSSYVPLLLNESGTIKCITITITSDIGVAVDGIPNPHGDKNLFWFREDNLEFCNDKSKKKKVSKISLVEKNLKDLKDDLSKEYAKIDWRLTQLEAKLASDDEEKASKFKIGDTVKIISLPDEFVPDAALGKIGVITGFVKTYPRIKVKFEKNDLPHEWTLSWFFNGSDLELVKVPLDVVEKEYLRVVIKPYKDKIAYVIKKEVKNCNGKFYYLKFYLKNDDTFELPLFKTTSNMYRGMDSDVKYHLSELGI